MAKSKNEIESKSVSATFCQHPSRKDPSKPCGNPILGRGMCRYHYDKWRHNEKRGTALEPIYRKDVVPIGAIPGIHPPEKRVFDLYVERTGKSAYILASEIIGEWAKRQPEYVDYDAAAKKVPDLVALAEAAKSLRPDCRCGKCVGCLARAALPR